MFKPKLPDLDTEALVRLLSGWQGNAGTITLYYRSKEVLPAKTRVIIDFVTGAFRRKSLAERFTAGN
jgi:DNA-binding transcriptional LysR family regulator